MSLGAPAVQTGAVQVGRPTRAHLYQLDVIRLLTCIGVVAIHTVELILPESRAGGAFEMALHTTRELFFFLTALALTYSTGAADRAVAAVPLWRRRYPLILVPYLAWTVLYWAGDTISWGQLWPPDVDLAQLGTDLLVGWNHLYFLFVTMQFYAVFPLVAWGLRRTRGWHWAVLGLSAGLELAATGLMQYASAEIPGPLRLWFDNADINVVSYQFAFTVGALTGAHLEAIVAFLRRNRQWVWLAAGAGVVIGEGVYLVNLVALGLAPQAAAAPLQPAIVPLTVAAVLALASVADWVVLRLRGDARVWRMFSSGAEASFGIFLAHVAVLYVLVQPPIRSVLGLEALPGFALVLVTFALTVAVTWVLVELLRRTPLSRTLTGRPRRA